MRRKRAVSIAIIAIFVLAVGCSKGPEDASIATEIKARMFSDPELKSVPINVEVQRGEVTLTGEVPSAELQLRAFKLASSTEGVSKVNDQLQLRPAVAGLPEEPDPVVTTPDTVAPAKPLVAPPTATKQRPRETPSKPAAQAAGAVPLKTQEQPRTEEPSRTEEPVKSAAMPASKTDTAPVEKLVEAPPAEPAKPQILRVEIPAGTLFTIRMVDTIDSSVNAVGEAFRATLEVPVVIDGKEIVPSKTEVYVELVEAKSAGRMSGQSELELRLHSMELDGQTYRLSSDTYREVGKSRGKDTAVKVGIATGIGTAVGAIAGGKKGAAIGAAVGGGAGVAVQAATRGQQVRVPSEMELEFGLRNPVTVVRKP